MGWLWSSSSSKAEPQQPTPTSIPIRSEPAPAPTPAQDAHSRDQASFNEAFPHLASAQNASAQKPPAPQDDDDTLPTTMSCRAAFDAAFYCASFGGRFNDIYRYGSLRSCSEHWADWRFCMTLTGTSAEGQAKAIKERYRAKEANVEKQPNSEDIWKRRGPDEQIKNPFRFAEEESKRVEEA